MRTAPAPARLRRVALALASLAFALGVAELCARAFAPSWLRARMREVAVGRALARWGSDDEWPLERDAGRPIRFVPGSRFTVRHDEYVHTARIDEFGGRASGHSASDPRPIVPVFGDSMTFGIGVRDEETFVSLVDRSLPVHLVNLGMPGSELLDQLESLERLHRALQSPPACVFVVFLGNDLTDIASTGAAVAREDIVEAAPLSSWLFAVNRALDEHSMLRRWYAVQWARAVSVRLVNASRQTPQVDRAFALMDRAAPLDRIRAAFEHATDRLASAAVRLRFTPLVVIAPDRLQVDERLRRDKAALYGVSVTSYDPRLANRIVTEALSARGIAFIDATPCLEGRGSQYYVRDTHFTAAGQATMASCVGPFLGERLPRALR